MHSSLRTVLEKKGSRIHAVEPEATVLQAVELMNGNRIGAVLVFADDKPVGIFTERDVLIRVVANGRDPTKTSVAEVMTRDLVVVGPDITVEQAMTVCTQERCRHLPVMEGNELLGLISSGDLTRCVTQSQSTEIQDLIRYIRGEYPT